MDPLSAEANGAVPDSGPLAVPFPNDWEEALGAERRKPYFKALNDFLSCIVSSNPSLACLESP